MSSLTMKSHQRPLTDTHGTEARLLLPHMGTTKAPHTSQHVCAIHILPTSPSPFPTLDTCCSTAATSKPRSLFFCLHWILSTPGPGYIPIPITVSSVWFSDHATSTSQEGLGRFTGSIWEQQAGQGWDNKGWHSQHFLVVLWLGCLRKAVGFSEFRKTRKWWWCMMESVVQLRLSLAIAAPWHQVGFFFFCNFQEQLSSSMWTY